MRLLFDENLSPELPKLLAASYPRSEHIRHANLVGADDAVVWQFAAANAFVLVTKDDDFLELSILRGSPPKVILIRLGNCRTAEVADLLGKEQEKVGQFCRDESAALLELP